jgi:predicted acylesterase/phospholipase RssA
MRNRLKFFYRIHERTPDCGAPNRLILISLLFLFIFTGCAHYRLNQPLESGTAKTRYDFKQFCSVTNPDGTFVVLTFSGGGIKASALAFGVLDKLRETVLPGSNRRLLDNVNIISTVSGGSFTGAYYALFGDRIFDDFREKFLYRNIQKALFRELLNPVNWVRRLSPNYSKSNIAAEFYDETIFESKTFGYLAEKPKTPFLIINATNMSLGTQFEFTSRQFDYLGSDLLSWPVAHAVAASSAFPFLMSPVTLKNYTNTAEYRVSAADHAALAEYWENKRRYYAAKNNLVYSDTKEHPFIHLVDGGISDNLGLRAIYNLFERQEMREKISNREIRRLLVIIVNARTEPQYKIDKNESPPGLFMVGLKAFTIPMHNYSVETIELFKTMLQQHIRTQENVSSCQKLLDAHCTDGFKIPQPAGGGLKLYVAELSFDNLADQAEKDYFNDLPTSFSLDKTQVDRLIDAGGQLLAEHPAFRQFMSEYSPD